MTGPMGRMRRNQVQNDNASVGDSAAENSGKRTSCAASREVNRSASPPPPTRNAAAPSGAASAAASASSAAISGLVACHGDAMVRLPLAARPADPADPAMYSV